MHNLICSICEREFTSKYPTARSCEACKQFFRRVVVECKLYECRWAGKCALERRCTSCRLDRCLRAGFNPRAVPVFHPDAKAQHYFAQLERRRARLDQQGAEAAPLVALNDATQIMRPVVLSDDKMAEIAQNFSEQMRIEEKLYRFFERKTVFRDGFLEQFASLKELINFGAKIVCNFNNFMIAVDNNTQEEQELLRIQSFNRPFFGSNNPDIRSLVSNIVMLDMLPNLALLNIDDKVCLLRYVAISMLDYFSRYHPTHMNMSSTIYPCGFNPMEYFKRHHLYRGDQTVQNLVENIYYKALEPFNRVRMDTEEFLMLRPIVFAHPAAPGLSAHGRTVLQRESERLARILLHFLQHRHGLEAGARRYAELMCLAETVFHGAHRRRDFFTYVIVTSDREAYDQQFPKVLKPMINAEMQ